jgi:hypothetical protein
MSQKFLLHFNLHMKKKFKLSKIILLFLVNLLANEINLKANQMWLNDQSKSNEKKAQQIPLSNFLYPTLEWCY